MEERQTSAIGYSSFLHGLSQTYFHSSKISFGTRRYNFYPNQPRYSYKAFLFSSLTPSTSPSIRTRVLLISLQSNSQHPKFSTRLSNMVKLTLVGRLSDGMPLSQTPTYLTEDHEVSSFYRQKGELVLKEIATAALTNSRMSILIDHHCFHYLIGNGVCFITLCESWYPRKLAFHYLQDLRKEFEKMDVRVVESFPKPYAFTRFDYVIGNLRKQYQDTRTQANLFKLNSNRGQDLDIVTEEFSKLISNHQTSGSEARASLAIPQTESTLWSSNLLEEIAIKWTPITVFVIAAALLLWTSFVLEEYSMLAAW